MFSKINNWKMLILVFIFPLSLLATETRVGSLGGTGFFIKDETNVFVYPATLSQYPKVFIVELRSNAIQEKNTFGAHFPVGNGVLGVYLNVPIYLNIPSLSDVENVSLTNKLSILYAFDMNDMNYGFRFSMGFDRYSSGGNPEKKESARYLELALGLSNSIMDIGLLIEWPKIKWEYNFASLSWGGLAFNLNGRYKYNYSSNLQFIPVGHVYYGPFSYKYDSGVSGVQVVENDQRELRFGIGIGTKYSLAEDKFFILGTELLGVQQSKYGNENEKTTKTLTTFPAFYAGVEMALKSWLTARLGAVQVYQKHTTVLESGAISNTSSVYQSGFKTTLGLGIRFGGFRIDLSLNESLLFEGPNFISGSNFPIANKISLIYTM